MTIVTYAGDRRLPSERAALEVRVPLLPKMVVNESDRGSPEAMVDEQAAIGDPPSGNPTSAWRIESRFWKNFPYSAYLDLGRNRHLSCLWLFDTHGIGELVVSAGEPGRWRAILTHRTATYMRWTQLSLDVTTRYLRLTRKTPGCRFAEIVLYEYTPEGYRAMRARKAAEEKARAERETALARAREEAKRRPWIDIGPPFGKLPLVDEIDCAGDLAEHGFIESPPGASYVTTILGRPCRVLKKTPGEAAYFAYRIGKWKLLEPGRAYVLVVEYPEDAPRTVIVMNGGNETIRGFHTGATVGDAFRPKYVNNNPESLGIPLSSRYESWRLFFHLHDRFPNLNFIRGKGRRELAPEDGFTVAICQFSAENLPVSHGAAVSRIRLFEVPNPETVYAPVRLPPADLPHRHLFWREEMADGVIASEKEEERGVTDPLDWYRYKASTMRLLAMNTFCKDLLEFGACQGWDSTAGGGNDWVYFNRFHKDWWRQIVAMMGRHGFCVLPYYEYAGSKGRHGLGNQRRAKPLTRDDAYTHIRWVENANADITDPDTYVDFKKMLDLTIVRYKDKARFAGAWLRQRGQMPLGFGEATRARFAREANGGQPISRRDLIEDPKLLGRYYDWWYGKRRQFLVAMRNHLRDATVNPKATILFTADPTEPGLPFPTWDRFVVTDDEDGWLKRLDILRARHVRPISIADVVRRDFYLNTLLSPRLNWGRWEWHHSSPPADPGRYKQTEGVLLTHTFNRLYTVASPKTLELFRGPSGLAIIRHYALNEHMMFDKNDQPKLGYFVADIERAGPYCMLAEARAVAYGDPTWIGYLVGSNFARGFPQYVRQFNQAFLALPALPSERLPNASSDPEVVVRAIRTDRHGTYLAVVNTGLHAKQDIRIQLPDPGRATDAATGENLRVTDQSICLSLGPCQLRSFHITPR